MTKTTDRADCQPCADARPLRGQPYQQELTPDPRRLGAIRRIFAAHISCWGWPEVIDEAVMCVTEMLANVHHHAEGACELLLEPTPYGVRITVSDTSSQLPEVRMPEWHSGSGRGMWLLSTTAHDWGAETTPTGKDVWVELRPSAEEAAA
ncbi:ATP-binding protein [Streptomyces albidoflavus]|uniref:ATP-binding protein n=1 Tax=Streptomyces albidoflavus TaxID=1886 RepID=UPI003431F8A7